MVGTIIVAVVAVVLIVGEAIFLVRFLARENQEVRDEQKAWKFYHDSALAMKKDCFMSCNGIEVPRDVPMEALKTIIGSNFEIREEGPFDTPMLCRKF